MPRDHLSVQVWDADRIGSVRTVFVVHLFAHLYNIRFGPFKWHAVAKHALSAAFIRASDYVR